MGEHWSNNSGWARSFLDCLLPNDGDTEELAAQGLQPGPTNTNPHVTPATVIRLPPSTYHEN